jgi:predicted ATPase
VTLDVRSTLASPKVSKANSLTLLKTNLNYLLAIAPMLGCEKAAKLWGKAGQRSLNRSALTEAVEQLSRALELIAALRPTTQALRREQINIQVAVITPLIHTKGYSAPETKIAAEQARLLIEQAEALGEPLEDPLLLFSVLCSFWVANYVAFKGDALLELATQFLARAEKQGTTVPLMIGHRLLGATFVGTAEFAAGRTHLDRALALYDPVVHRPLATLFGLDSRVSILNFRSWSLWSLGYPDAALADVHQALSDARELGQAATLMYALGITSLTHTLCGNYTAANTQLEEVAALANEKSSSFWQAVPIGLRGCLFAQRTDASNAVHMITSGIAALRSTGADLWMTWLLSNLTRAYAQLGQFDDAWRSNSETMIAMETSKERLFEVEVHRTAAEIALLSPEHDAVKAETYFERALAVARQQQAKSWELRAAMSLARLWRDQGKVQQARELLAPVYGWFTEGFDTRDLREAKTLLAQLAT